MTEGETERGREGVRVEGGRKSRGAAGNRWTDLEEMAKKSEDTEERKIKRLVRKVIEK